MDQDIFCTCGRRFPAGTEAPGHVRCGLCGALVEIPESAAKRSPRPAPAPAGFPRAIRYAILFALVGVLLAVLVGVRYGPAWVDSIRPRPASSGYATGGIYAATPQDYFEMLLRRPMPALVTHLEGGGESGSDYRVYLRFQATEKLIDSLLDRSGYVSVPWEEVTEAFALPKGYEMFIPKWDPAAAADKECYRGVFSNRWSPNGEHYLLVDRATRTVYFHGVGK